MESCKIEEKGFVVCVPNKVRAHCLWCRGRDKLSKTNRAISAQARTGRRVVHICTACYTCSTVDLDPGCASRSRADFYLGCCSP